jgi:LppX_LprAFG lipoprotein
MVRRLFVVVALATLVLGACSSPSSAPALTDPKDILSKSVLSLKDVKSVHLKADVTGQIKLDLSGKGAGGSIDLKGTTAEGDVDIANKKAHLSFSAPGLFGVTGDLIVVGDTSYVKVSLLGDKYTKSVTSNSADPSASAATDPQTIIDEVKKALDQLSVPPTKRADEKCGDQDCYHVSLTLKSSDIAGAVGSAAPSGLSGDGTIDVWVQKNNLRPAKLTAVVNAGDTGTINVTLTMSAYDTAVTITAPPDDQVEASSTP